MKPALFISDLHLCSTRPNANRIFFDFLATTALQAEALYVLGDLFEYWAGDDDLASPLHTEVVNAFARLRKAGVALYLMQGNRDFLIGEAFARACGATLLPDPYLINLHGTPTLLMHGDTLCIGDAAYMEFRGKVRNPAWQQEFLAKPLAERKAIIEGLRQDSETEKAGKTACLMDVNEEAVMAAFRHYRCQRIIHGHIHRQERHEYMVDGRNCERWVLADWHDRGSCLRCDETGCEFKFL